MELGFDIYKYTVTSYTTQTTSPKNTYGKKLNECDEKYVNVVLCDV